MLSYVLGEWICTETGDGINYTYIYVYVCLYVYEYRKIEITSNKKMDSLQIAIFTMYMYFLAALLHKKGNVKVHLSPKLLCLFA